MFHVPCSLPQNPCSCLWWEMHISLSSPTATRFWQPSLCCCRRNQLTELPALPASLNAPCLHSHCSVPPGVTTARCHHSWDDGIPFPAGWGRSREMPTMQTSDNCPMQSSPAAGSTMDHICPCLMVTPSLRYTSLVQE